VIPVRFMADLGMVIGSARLGVVRKIQSSMSTIACFRHLAKNLDRNTTANIWPASIWCL